jgi:hypothetical protein
MREEGSRDNDVRDDGGAISMVHRCGLRPADGESEPNYWLGYSSGPRTDQQYSRTFKGKGIFDEEGETFEFVSGLR